VLCLHYRYQAAALDMRLATGGSVPACRHRRWVFNLTSCCAGPTGQIRPNADVHTNYKFGKGTVFSHIFIGVKDLERAFGFYSKLMEVMGNTLRFCDRERPWAGWQSHPEPRPLFLIGAPYDGNAHDSGNGQMVAFIVSHRAAVDSAYCLALDSGGASKGAQVCDRNTITTTMRLI
jgi:hypothetical protein